jgi:hypothetical protein
MNACGLLLQSPAVNKVKVSHKIEGKIGLIDLACSAQ